MFLMSRIVSRLGAISIKTGALPLFSWSLASRSSSESPVEVSVTEVLEKNETQDLRAYISTHVDKGQKVFFMGEHHEQPRVLAAQLTILDELAKQGPKQKRPIVVVTEQFNVMQQAMLQKFNEVSDEPQEGDEQAAAAKLLDDYAEDGTEGWDLTHYMPLLLLARHTRCKIVGGFPPRAWARTISKEGIDALREQQAQSIASTGFDRWDDLKCSPQHAAYLRSLMSGEPPALVDEGQPQKSIHTAQAFKDAMLAFTIDKELDENDIAPIVLVITGSGHCEYGFGGPERLRSPRSEDVNILICKSNQESTIWKGEHWAGEAQEVDRPVADAIFCYDQAVSEE